MDRHTCTSLPRVSGTTGVPSKPPDPVAPAREQGWRDNGCELPLPSRCKSSPLPHSHPRGMCTGTRPEDTHSVFPVSVRSCRFVGCKKVPFLLEFAPTAYRCTIPVNQLA